MESWSFDYVRTDSSVSTADAMDWESKSPFIFGDENQGFGEMYFPQTVNNSLFSPVMDAFSEENESTSSKITNDLSSSEVGMPPFCQVHGCNKSLVSCKDYHKRHKVCEVHSKTAKVIVKGIEQRFCQQCSRFHILSEFDDGKRSCRKRLADHNERRRKPHSRRHGRLVPSYNITRDGPAGSKSKGPSGAKVPPSSKCHDIWHTILEDDLRCITDVSSCDIGQQYPSLHGHDGFITMESRSALSLLSSQSSRNWLTNYSAGQASGVPNNMNPLVGSECMDPSGDRPTIDLLQLSSELERVEHEKQIFIKKGADGASVGVTIT